MLKAPARPRGRADQPPVLPSRPAPRALEAWDVLRLQRVVAFARAGAWDEVEDDLAGLLGGIEDGVLAQAYIEIVGAIHDLATQPSPPSPPDAEASHPAPVALPTAASLTRAQRDYVHAVTVALKSRVRVPPPQTSDGRRPAA